MFRLRASVLGSLVTHTAMETGFIKLNLMRGIVKKHISLISYKQISMGRYFRHTRNRLFFFCLVQVFKYFFIALIA